MPLALLFIEASLMGVLSTGHDFLDALSPRVRVSMCGPMLVGFIIHTYILGIT